VIYLRNSSWLPPLLADAELSKHAALWRLAAGFAGSRDRTARELECLERALGAEFLDLPEVIKVKQVEEDYGKLMGITNRWPTRC
jgi:hypothetical protein